ncbi:ABC transporter ATP-binding protein [Streptomyces sp. NPDC006923]|uniref:ABC transporter ATP-binding protein n=1 Tax=Streptomyces sp. NPDC006923 TaxID=3155355 RepID=UPI00340CAEB6
MIDIDSLSKSYGPRTVWSDVTFSISRRELVAVVGPSGSGKSTLLNCLGLLDTPSGGAIRHEGKEITRFDKRGVRHFRRDVLGYLFQNYALIDNATVAANVEVAVRPRQSLWRNPRIAVAEALDRVGLAGREKEKVHKLSGGEQQRVALARLMVKQPALVLADEPTGALDHANTTMVVDILREMSDAGCAVVIATHNDYVRDRCEAVLTLGRALPGAGLPVEARAREGYRQTPSLKVNEATLPS